MSWEADEAFIGKKNPLTNETGFSGKLSYLGKTTMTLNIPYLGRKISFIINVDGELKITRKDNGFGRISWIFNVQNVDPRETVEWYIVQGSAYYEIFALGNGYDNGGEGENESGEPWNGCEIIRKSEWSEWNADPDRVNEPVVIQAVWGSKTGTYETDMEEM